MIFNFEVDVEPDIPRYLSIYNKTSFDTYEAYFPVNLINKDIVKHVLPYQISLQGLIRAKSIHRPKVGVISNGKKQSDLQAAKHILREMDIAKAINKTNNSIFAGHKVRLYIKGTFIDRENFMARSRGAVPIPKILFNIEAIDIILD